ncbi:MAG: tetratricopeptide repeat protein, partial [Thermoguttaceae bacterium]
LLFLVFRRMTGAVWPCAMVAIVFAIHPLRAESVAWVSERKDLLSGLFFFLTLWAYVSYTQHRFSWRRYLTVVVLFALGLMSKPMLVTLPCVLLLLDYWPLGRVASDQWPVARDRSRDSNSASGAASCSSLATDHRPLSTLLLEKLPLLAMSAVSSVLTHWAQGAAVISWDVLPASVRIANAIVSYAAYVRQLVWPVGLAAFYPHPQDNIQAWRVMLSAVFLLTVTALVLWKRRQRPYWPVGWFWYVGMLVPVIGLVQVGGHAMADRYTYLPEIGLCVALAWTAAAWIGDRPIRRKIGAVASALIVLALMACAFRQVQFWRDSETLLNRDLTCAEPSIIAYHNLGVALLGQHRDTEALVQFQKLLTLNPDYPNGHFLLGVALAGLGRTEEAIEHYQTALALKPKSPEVLTKLGDAVVTQGQTAKGIDYYRRALKLEPNEGPAHIGLANVLADQRHYDEAIEHYRKALEIKPDFMQGYLDLGATLVDCGRVDEAIDEYHKAIKIRPDFAEAYYNLANALASQGRLDQAVAQYQKTLELTPNMADAHNNLGMALSQLGRPREAVGQWREAIRLQPDLTGSLAQLAWTLATSPDDSLRNGTDALALAQRLVRSTQEPPAQWLDILAASLAASDRFTEAVATQQQAVAAAQRQHDAAKLPSLRQRLKLYQAGKPYRETPSGPGK